MINKLTNISPFILLVMFSCSSIDTKTVKIIESKAINTKDYSAQYIKWIITPEDSNYGKFLDQIYNTSVSTLEKTPYYNKAIQEISKALFHNNFPKEIIKEVVEYAFCAREPVYTLEYNLYRKVSKRFSLEKPNKSIFDFTEADPDLLIDFNMWITQGSYYKYTKKFPEILNRIPIDQIGNLSDEIFNDQRIKFSNCYLKGYFGSQKINDIKKKEMITSHKEMGIILEKVNTLVLGFKKSRVSRFILESFFTSKGTFLNSPIHNITINLQNIIHRNKDVTLIYADKMLENTLFIVHDLNKNNTSNIQELILLYCHPKN